MKKLRLLALMAVAVFFSADFSLAQKAPGIDASPADISYLRTEGRKGDVVAKVVYGRPQKKGRTMLGGVEKYGEVWRTGANETTERSFYRDVNVGDMAVKAGTYSLYTIPNKDQWTIILNSKLDTWCSYNYDKSQDVARINVPAGTSNDEVEAFAIYFEEPKSSTSNMILAWEKTMVKVPIKF